MATSADTTIHYPMSMLLGIDSMSGKGSATQHIQETCEHVLQPTHIQHPPLQQLLLYLV